MEVEVLASGTCLLGHPIAPEALRPAEPAPAEAPAAVPGAVDVTPRRTRSRRAFVPDDAAPDAPAEPTRSIRTAPTPKTPRTLKPAPLPASPAAREPKAPRVAPTPPPPPPRSAEPDPAPAVAAATPVDTSATEPDTDVPPPIETLEELLKASARGAPPASSPAAEPELASPKVSRPWAPVAPDGPSGPIAPPAGTTILPPEPTSADADDAPVRDALAELLAGKEQLPPDPEPRRRRLGFVRRKDRSREEPAALLHQEAEAERVRRDLAPLPPPPPAPVERIPHEASRATGREAEPLVGATDPVAPSEPAASPPERVAAPELPEPPSPPPARPVQPPREPDLLTPQPAAPESAPQPPFEQIEPAAAPRVAPPAAPAAASATKEAPAPPFVEQPVPESPTAASGGRSRSRKRGSERGPADRPPAFGPEPVAHAGPPEPVAPAIEFTVEPARRRSRKPPVIATVEPTPVAPPRAMRRNQRLGVVASTPRNAVAWGLLILITLLAGVAAIAVAPDGDEPRVQRFQPRPIALTSVPGYTIRPDSETESRLRAELGTAGSVPRQLSVSSVLEPDGDLVAQYQAAVYAEDVARSPEEREGYIVLLADSLRVTPETFTERPLDGRIVYTAIIPEGQAVLLFRGPEVVLVLTAATGAEGDALADKIFDARRL